MLANALVELFVKGGPIMWPILLVAIVLLSVVAERSAFWFLEGRRRDAAALERVLAALDHQDIPAAVEASRRTGDPVVRMMHEGLTHGHGSLAGALQVAAGVEVQRSGRFMVAIDTCITLAPLLGLLGTVVGIMESFEKVTGELAVEGVSKGIGEALIATAAGLAIAIVGVFFLNLFNGFLARLQFDLETAATNVEVMVGKATQEGFDTPRPRRQAAATANANA